MIIVNQRGLNDAAAVGIVEKVMSFLFLIPSSMLSTVSALGAQNIGADKPERAMQTLQYAVMLAVGFGVFASIAIQFTAEPIVALFTDQSTTAGAEVVHFGGQYLRGYIFDCIFAGVHFSFSGYFCACGKSGLSFLHNILAIALVRIPGVYLTSQLFPTTLSPMGLATAAGSLLSVVICLIAFAVIKCKSTLNSVGGIKNGSQNLFPIITQDHDLIVNCYLHVLLLENGAPGKWHSREMELLRNGTVEKWHC